MSPSYARTLLLSLAVLGSALPAVRSYEDTCAPFHEIYEDGEDLCNTIFGDSFVYSEDPNAYTMWWVDAGSNPNDAITAARGGTTPDTCDLQYFHKTEPSPEGDDFTECHPWKDSACCHEATVTTPKAMNEGYGAGYEWDRCGPMSEACQRFFVQEACFYECEPNAGLFRKYTDEEAATVGHEGEGNQWQMEGMPIQAGYCNAWYDACRNDHFCGLGSFWECEAHHHVTQGIVTVNVTNNVTKIEIETEEVEKIETGVVVAVAVVAGVLAMAIGALVCMERSGKAVFAPYTSVMTEPGTEMSKNGGAFA